ncbi:hypothetical protein ACSVDE_03635 [Pseudalkalibacillus sp. Hm43]|uniref:hypothetical protein n=1 Tax=Pseudalkalibacillus sp. Hm43 TaxID=3450742 RepID=UPI003F420F9D
MSKYIVHHKTRVIHHSSFVCDACQIPSYEHRLREDTIDEEYVIDLLEKSSYQTCPYCMDHDTLMIRREKRTRIV